LKLSWILTKLTLSYHDSWLWLSAKVNIHVFFLVSSFGFIYIIPLPSDIFPLYSTSFRYISLSILFHFLPIYFPFIPLPSDIFPLYSTSFRYISPLFHFLPIDFPFYQRSISSFPYFPNLVLRSADYSRHKKVRNYFLPNHNF